MTVTQRSQFVATPPADVLAAKIKEYYTSRRDFELSIKKEGKGIRAYISVSASKYLYTCPISGPQYDEETFMDDCYLSAPKTSFVSSMAFKEAFNNAELQISEIAESLKEQAESWRDGEERDYDLERKEL